MTQSIVRIILIKMDNEGKMSPVAEREPTTYREPLPFPSEPKKIEDLYSYVADFLVLTFKGDESEPTNIVDIKAAFFKNYATSHEDIVIFLEADASKRFMVITESTLDTETILIRRTLPLTEKEKRIISALDTWRQSLAYNLSMINKSVELNKVCNVVPRPVFLTDSLKAQKLRNIFEQDPLKRFKIIGEMPSLRVKRANLDDAETADIINNWIKQIAAYLSVDGMFKKVSDITHHFPKPCHLPAAVKIIAILRSDPSNRFQFVGEGHSLAVKIVTARSMTHVRDLTDDWRAKVINYLLIKRGDVALVPCEIGANVQRPDYLPHSYKLLDVLQSDPAKRFTFSGVNHDLKVAVKKGVKPIMRAGMKPLNGTIPPASGLAHEKVDSGPNSGIISAGINNVELGDWTRIVQGVPKVSSVAEGYLKKDDIDNNFFKTSQSLLDNSSVNNSLGSAALSDNFMKDSNMFPHSNFLRDAVPSWDLQNPGNGNMRPGPPGLSHPRRTSGDYMSSFLDSSEMEEIQWPGSHSGKTPGGLGSLSGGSSFNGSALAEQNDLWMSAEASLPYVDSSLPAMTYSPFGTHPPIFDQVQNESNVTNAANMNSSTNLAIASLPKVPPPDWVDLKDWLPSVLNGFDSVLVASFIDQMRDDFGFLSTEDLYNARLENQLTFESLKDIVGFKIGHFNRIVRGLAAYP